MSSSTPSSPKRRKKGESRVSSKGLPKQLRKLCDNEDALSYLCSFIEPSSKPGAVLNEVRRPALMVECEMNFFAFVEQAPEPKHWKVTFVDRRLRLETCYRKQGDEEERNDFLWNLFHWIIDRASFQFGGGSIRTRKDASIFFSEARTVEDYRAFLTEYKSYLVKWPNSTYENANKRSRLCNLWDPWFRDCGRDLMTTSFLFSCRESAEVNSVLCRRLENSGSDGRRNWIPNERFSLPITKTSFAATSAFSLCWRKGWKSTRHGTPSSIGAT